MEVGVRVGKLTGIIPCRRTIVLQCANAQNIHNNRVCVVVYRARATFNFDLFHNFLFFSLFPPLFFYRVQL